MNSPSPPPALPRHWKEQEQLLFDFDQAWRGPTPPRIVDFLSRLPAEKDPQQRPFFEELVKIDLEYRWRKPGAARWVLENYLRQFPALGEASLALIGQEYLIRQLWGDRPKQVEYVSRFPRHGAALLAELARIDAELATEFRKQEEWRPVTPLSPPATLPAAAISLTAMTDLLRQGQLLNSAQKQELAGGLASRFGDARDLARELLRRAWLTAYQANQLLQGRGSELVLGHYVLLERLGEGGAGQVFKAQHRPSNRIVALKLIRKHLLAEAEVVSRFYREFQLLSQLDHPNIVRASDSGQVGATHFLAMEFVEGTDLGRLVKQGGPAPIMQACEYVRQAALGLQHAHERGLVHRDIKPHNLIMSVRDGLIKVADLGLARLPRTMTEEATASLTTGTLTPENAVMMGTADYLAPEQALDFHQADIRADIYSLGCTLYFLLTGQTPFPGGNLAQKVAKHMQAEPEAPERLRQDIPPGLTRVISKMMAKRPEDRYQQPADVAAALAPFAGSAAQAAARPRRILGSLHRHKGRAALVVGLVLALGLVLLVGLPGRRVSKDGPFAPQKEREFRLHRQELMHAVAISPRARQVASAGDGKIKDITLWDLTTGEEQFTLPGHKETVTHLVFSPNGRFLASGSVGEKNWKLWDLNTRTELGSFPVDKRFHPNIPMVGPFSPDGRYLAACQGEGVVALWNVDTRTRTATYPGDATALAFSTDSRSLAIAASGVDIYDIASGEKKHLFAGGNYVHSMAFSADLLAVAWSNQVYLHKRDPGTPPPPPIVCQGHTEAVQVMAFSPDGKLLATGSSTPGKTGEVRLWNAATGQELHRLGTREGYAKPVHALAFSADGKTLYTGSDDDMVRVWRIGE